MFGKKGAKGRAGSRESQVQSFFGEESEIQPRGFTPTEVKPWKYHLLRFGVRWGSWMGVIALLLVTYSLANPIQPPEPPEPPALASPGKSVATRSVGQWLASEPQPLPGGTILSWDGFEELPMPEIPGAEEMDEEELAEETPTYNLEVHDFTVMDNNNMLYTASVQVADDSVAGPQVLGSPSLMPQALASTNFQMDNPWPGMASQSMPPTTDTSVNSWAEAFTSGRPDDLRQAVGDPDVNHSYTPLYRVQEFEVTTTESAYFNSVNDEGAEVQDQSRALMRVDLVLRWEGQSIPEESRESTMSYDLLMVGVDSASPRVVAWGPPGTGPQLEEYSNALDGRDYTGVEDPSQMDEEDGEEGGAPAGPPPPGGGAEDEEPVEEEPAETQD